MNKIFLFSLLFFCSATYTKQLTLVLNPAGDAKTTGRQIGDNFERSLTLHFCEQLKREIEKRYNIVVVLTRTAGQTLEPLQAAQFSNKLSADLFITIHMCAESGLRNQLWLYMCGTPDDTRPSYGLSFMPYDQSYIPFKSATQSIVSAIHATCSDIPYKNSFDCALPVHIPCKPLLGVTAPSLAIEMSLKNSNDWQTFIEPLVMSMARIIAQLEIQEPS